MTDQRQVAVDRRSFLKAASALPLAFAGTRSSREARAFEVVVSVNVVGAKAASRVWLPLPSSTTFQHVNSLRWEAGAAEAVVAQRGARMLTCGWPAGSPKQTLTLTIVASARDRLVSLDTPASGPGRLAKADYQRYVKPTRWIPTDGIVRQTAARIVAGHASPLSRARSIYEWIVEHTFRDPAVKGCGTGDIRWMLESGSLGGKCADLNALFVGLCRSIGLPARDWYGIRVGESRDFKSLGRSGDITSAQHCRAEVFVDGVGWIPVDPADVRKVVLEERPGTTLADPDAVRARRQFFGAWEMNWLAFNDAHDILLPDSTGAMLPFLMYPQAEVSGVRRNSLDPQRFEYRITAREVTAPAGPARF